MPQDPRWDGLLLIDKPKGLSSHDVVARVRRAAGQKRVGHTGTLDPMATGLMAVLLGSATRLEPYLTKMDKSYSGRIELGLATDSDDITGNEISRAPGPWPVFEEAASALKKYEGETAQIPPAYSAIKVGGKRAYKAARQGEPLALPARRVTAYHLNITAYAPPFLDFAASVSSGYYIRSLARDVGADLGLGGALASLRRETVGAWSVAEAVTLEELAQWTDDDWRARLLPPAQAVPHLPSVTLTPTQATAFCQGKLIEVKSLEVDCQQVRPPANRHSSESWNPSSKKDMNPGRSHDDGGECVAEHISHWKWIPAFAGMTGSGGESMVNKEIFLQIQAGYNRAAPVSGKNPLDKTPIKVLNTEGLLLGLGTVSPHGLLLRPLRVFPPA